MKSIFKISIIILIIAGLSIVGYLAWIYLVAPRITPSEETALPGEAQPAIPNVPVPLTANKVFDYWINKKTKEVHYLDENGQIYKITKEGEQVLSSQNIAGLNHIKPNGDGTLVLVGFGYPATPTFAIFNTLTKSWQAMPANTTSAAWSPSAPTGGPRLAYLRNGRLYLLTLADQKSKEIIKIDQKDLELEWVLPDVVYLKERPSIQLASSIWSININTKEVRSLAKPESGLLVRWFGDSKTGIKFTNSLSKENLLQIVNLDNQPLGSVGLITLPSKCAFNALGTALYCAATKTEISGVSLPDDYLKRAVYFQDDIYQLSLIDLGGQLIGLPTKILDTESVKIVIDADQLEVNSKQLLFINRYDKKLYSLAL